MNNLPPFNVYDPFDLYNINPYPNLRNNTTAASMGQVLLDPSSRIAHSAEHCDDFENTDDVPDDQLNLGADPSPTVATAPRIPNAEACLQALINHLGRKADQLDVIPYENVQFEPYSNSDLYASFKLKVGKLRKGDTTHPTYAYLRHQHTQNNVPYFRFRALGGGGHKTFGYKQAFRDTDLEEPFRPCLSAQTFFTVVKYCFLKKGLVAFHVDPYYASQLLCACEEYIASRPVALGGGERDGNLNSALAGVEPQDPCPIDNLLGSPPVRDAPLGAQESILYNPYLEPGPSFPQPPASNSLPRRRQPPPQQIMPRLQRTFNPFGSPSYYNEDDALDLETAVWGGPSAAETFAQPNNSLQFRPSPYLRPLLAPENAASGNDHVS